MPFRLNQQHFNPTTYRAVRSLWFEGIPDTARCPPMGALQKWFGVGRSKEDRHALDRECESKFRSALDSVGPENYRLPPIAADYAAEKEQASEIAQPFVEAIKTAESPETASSTALGLILLFDQMTRNIYRANQALIYTHHDRIARAIARTALDPSESWDVPYKHNFIYRAWFFFPLEHSEHMEDHVRVQNLFAQAEDDARKERDDEGVRQFLRTFRSEEDDHFQILKQFGRYPHRNQVLGRSHTEAEQNYLRSGDARTFGTGDAPP